MGTRLRAVIVILASVAPALPGCATRQVKLEMTRQVVLIPPIIKDLRVDPAGRLDTRSGGHTVKVTLTGDPELQATFDLKGRLQGQKMQETEPGVYVASFEVRPNDTGTLDVVGHLTHEPTGARQDRREEGALVLFTSEDGRACLPAARDDLEEKLGNLTVYFEFNKFDITPESSRALGEGRAVLESRPECLIHLHGHADEVGSEEYNTVLSAQRAGEVASFLQLSLGIPAGRLAIHWHGESRPADTSGSPEGRARNRRVELTASGPE